MPVIIGLLIIPFIILIIKKSNEFTTKRSVKILLNLSLALISIVFIVFCIISKKEPFTFEELYSDEYMFLTGNYILSVGLIILFTPFIWIVIVHFIKLLISSIRIRTNATINSKEKYLYYRGDLDKVSPGIIMFTSMFDIDTKNSVASTILKLKLNGYIKETNGELIYTNKDQNNLLESEKMVLSLIKSKTFNEGTYRKTIEQETLKNRYISKNYGGIPARILKILLAILVPFLVFKVSYDLDQYTFENYHIWPDSDGHSYIQFGDPYDISELDYSYIRADKMEYGPVRKAVFLNTLVPLLITLVPVAALFALYVTFEQLKYIKKGYTPTIKGKQLLNKAYALKNYLKDYSLIKNRTEEELILWEYYLVYAVGLDVNNKIDDKLIQKYVKEIK